MKVHALGYLKLGYSVIPVDKDKKPLIQWKPYQEKYPTTNEVEEWWDKWPDSNIAIVMGSISDVIGIDIDTQEGQKLIDELLPPNFISPTAKSPHGKHIYCKWEPGLRNNVRAIEGVDLRAEGGYLIAPPSKGNGKNYSWLIDPFTTKPASIPPLYLKKIKKAQDPFTVIKNNIQCDINGLNFCKGSRNDSIFHVANILSKGDMPQRNIEAILHRLAATCNPPLSQKEADSVIISAIDRVDRYQGCLAQDIRDWVMESPGQFDVKDIFNSLSITKRREKKQTSDILAKLVKDKILQRHHSRRGLYIRPDVDLQELDWLKASTSDFGMILPFGLSNMVKIHPKGIVIIAGDQNAGKTAIMLNILKNNMNIHKTSLFSSEMAAAELKERLVLFKDIPLTKWNFKAYDRNHDFDQVLDPDGLNLIDYMEVNDDFWKVGHHIARIHYALKKGVAVIALQKKRGADVGRGGDFTLEKPRLYLTLAVNPDDPDIFTMRIRKAKNYKDPKNNPNGAYLKFSIQGGCELKKQSGWQKL